jgi:hypothetical protein
MHRDFESNENNKNSTQEITSQDTSSWRIEFVEKPLDLGFIDNLIFKGRNAGHSFLRLVDQYDKVRGELHGYSYDPDKEQISDANFNPWKRVKHKFARSTLPFNPNTIKVFHFGFERSRHPKLEAQTVLEGDRTQVIASWMKAINRGMDINAEEHEYRPLSLLQFRPAQNCHTVSSDLLEAMDVSSDITTKYAAPGLMNSIETSPEVRGSIMQNPAPQHLRNLYHAMASWSEKLIPNMSASIRTSAQDIKAVLSHDQNGPQMDDYGLHPAI